jgi:hypothetical protein
VFKVMHDSSRLAWFNTACRLAFSSWLSGVVTKRAKRQAASSNTRHQRAQRLKARDKVHHHQHQNACCQTLAAVLINLGSKAK